MEKQQIKEKLLKLGVFEDNKYLDDYCELIVLNCFTKKEKFKTQCHHIIPKCIFKYLRKEIDNSPGNLVNLLYKDHILAHYYLCLCSLKSIQYRLANAFFHLSYRKWKYEDFNPKMDLDKYQEIYESYTIQMAQDKERNLKISNSINLIEEEKLNDIYNLRSLNASLKKESLKLEIIQKIFRSRGQELLSQVVERVSKEDLFNYYIKENHNKKDTCNYFQINDSRLSSLMNYYGLRKTTPHKKHISHPNIKLGFPIKCIETGEVFNSAEEAGRKYNRDPSNIRRAAKQGILSAKKHWVILDKENLNGKI